MGSRAVAIVARSPEALARRFGVSPGEPAGLILTRTGRPFFTDPTVAEAAVDEIRAAADRSGTWDRLGSDWLVLDGEILPWSAKADPLVRRTYAAVAAGGRLWGPAALDALRAADDRGVPGLGELLATTEQRAAAVAAFGDAYQPYVHPVQGLSGLGFAPFAIVAADGQVTARRDNRWQLAECDRLAGGDPNGFVTRTERVEVELGDPSSVAAASGWWEALTACEGEGMVVKPIEPVTHGPKGLVQPALKCRGYEYLRLVYGPEYTLAHNMERLRSRNVGRKRSLALREFALGLEALDRFVAGEPLWRVHECVYSVLALESEPVDPRL